MLQGSDAEQGQGHAAFCAPAYFITDIAKHVYVIKLLAIRAAQTP